MTEDRDPLEDIVEEDTHHPQEVILEVEEREKVNTVDLDLSPEIEEEKIDLILGTERNTVVEEREDHLFLIVDQTHIENLINLTQDLSLRVSLDPDLIRNPILDLNQDLAILIDFRL